MSFSREIPTLAECRLAALKWQRRKARRQAMERFRDRLLRPFRRVRSRLSDWGWRRVERSEAKIRASEADKIAADAALVLRLKQAARIGSLVALAQLQDMAADRVGQARRDRALDALTRLRESQK
jgi:hypothetical protein